MPFPNNRILFFYQRTKMKERRTTKEGGGGNKKTLIYFVCLPFLALPITRLSGRPTLVFSGHSDFMQVFLHV